MRKALIPAFLLVVAAIVLGSTLFHEQIVSAATTPFQNVVVQNTNTNPIPVQQVGTSTTSVSGTVGIDSSKNTVKLDSNANTVKLDANGNTVNLDSTDAANLANVVGDLGNLRFDGSGNLETATQAAAPAAVTDVCMNQLNVSDFDVSNDKTPHTLCSFDEYLTNITTHGMDDTLDLEFLYKGSVVLSLIGSGGGFSGAGSSDWQLDLSHPLHVDTVDAICSNASTTCEFSMVLLGNSTGT